MRVPAVLVLLLAPCVEPEVPGAVALAWDVAGDEAAATASATVALAGADAGSATAAEAACPDGSAAAMGLLLLSEAPLPPPHAVRNALVANRQARAVSRTCGVWARDVMKKP
jgi:hypothetical protein